MENTFIHNHPWALIPGACHTGFPIYSCTRPSNLPNKNWTSGAVMFPPDINSRWMRWFSQALNTFGHMHAMMIVRAIRIIPSNISRTLNIKVTHQHYRNISSSCFALCVITTTLSYSLWWRTNAQSISFVISSKWKSVDLYWLVWYQILAHDYT